MSDRVLVIHETDSAQIVTNPPQSLVVIKEPSDALVVTGPTVETTTVLRQDAAILTVTAQAPSALVVRSPAQGPPGPPGRDGGGTDPYPVTAISSFSQLHNFAYPPEVRLIDDTGELVDVGVEYPDDTHVYISFPTPFTGTIYLS